jgi:hypothetical protein
MGKKHEPPGDWFVQQRTRSLATVYLTRRDDLAITAPDDNCVDLHVVINTNKETTNRRFGVVLRGTTRAVAVDAVNAILTPTLESLASADIIYPVGLFFFVMETDGGYFTWVTEPSVTSDGTPTLTHNTVANCVPLDTAAIDAIVERVNDWYDAFCAKVSLGTNGAHGKNGVAVLHGIIDGEAAFYSKNGQVPRLLRLPIPQAYELAKLGREHLGELANRIIKSGVGILEEDGLLGMKVQLVTNQADFSFE